MTRTKHDTVVDFHALASVLEDDNASQFIKQKAYAAMVELKQEYKVAPPRVHVEFKGDKHLSDDAISHIEYAMEILRNADVRDVVITVLK